MQSNDEISSRSLRGGRRFDRLAQSFAFSRGGGSATRYARTRGYVGAEVAAEGKLDVPILGEQKIISTARAFGIETSGRELTAIASELADALLEDLSRAIETMNSYVPF